MKDERLLLLAHEPDEVPLLSALTLSAIVQADDVAYDRRARRLVLLMNRYRWEAAGTTRVRSALRIESVVSVRRRHWRGSGAADPLATTLELLAFTLAGSVVTLSFAGGAALGVEVETTDMVLEDITGPWAATRAPAHD